MKLSESELFSETSKELMLKMAAQIRGQNFADALCALAALAVATCHEQKVSAEVVHILVDHCASVPWPEKKS